MDITQCSRAATTSPKPHIMEYNLNDSAKDILEADEELGFLLEFPSLRLMKIRITFDKTCSEFNFEPLSSK